MISRLSKSDLIQFDPRGGYGGLEQRYCCPFCGYNKPVDADHRCLSINAENGLFCCHRCGAKGKLRENWLEKPRKRNSTKIAHSVFANEQSEKGATMPNCNWKESIEGRRSLTGTEGETYLISRGLYIGADEDVCFHPNFYYRSAVLFGIRDQRGNLVAAHGRYLDRETPKVRTVGPKAEGAFLTHGVLQSPMVGLVEAPIDALSLRRCGVPSIAFVGTSWPRWLREHLIGRSVLVATDTDAPGEETAKKLMAELSFGSRCVRLHLPQGYKDVNEVLQRFGINDLTAHLKPYIARVDSTAAQPYEHLSQQILFTNLPG